MPIKLYAGDVPDMPEYAGLTGLSLRQKNDNHIKHDVTKRHPFKDNSVNSYQSEDVFEHIEYDKIADIINDIYRILKPGGLFRLSLPDYRCDVLRKRSIYEDGEIVYDPFGGGGTTVDVCRRMFRRYYVSDRKVLPGREKDIREWDIKNGLPEDLQKPKLVFLDPPYWKQAAGQYSNDSDDLGNMELDKFNSSMKKFLDLLSDRKIEKIAIVIQPTQYRNNFTWTDHIFDFNSMLQKYRIEMRYILPYSTQQYLPQHVDKAKAEKKCLGLNRDLVLWTRI